MMPRAGLAGTGLFVLFGPIVWGLHLGVSYAAHAGLCAAGDRLPLGTAALPWLLGAATAAASILIVMALVFPALLRSRLGAAREGEEASFATAVMRFLGLLSLAGVGYLGLTLAMLPLCAPLR